MEREEGETARSIHDWEVASQGKDSRTIRSDIAQAVAICDGVGEGISVGVLDERVQFDEGSADGAQFGHGNVDDLWHDGREVLASDGKGEIGTMAISVRGSDRDLARPSLGELELEGLWIGDLSDR